MTSPVFYVKSIGSCGIVWVKHGDFLVLRDFGEAFDLATWAYSKDERQSLYIVCVGDHGISEVRVYECAGP